MNTLRFYGCSDDLVELENVAIAIDETLDEEDYDNANHRNDVTCRGGKAEFNVGDTSHYIVSCVIDNYAYVDKDDALSVYAIYGDNGCWHFAVGVMNDETPAPDWHVRIVKKHEYSMMLEIDMPGKAAVVRDK